MIHHDGSPPDQSVSNRAYEYIRSRVLNGEFAAGRRLVTRQIAQELGASLNPVREALGRLAAEGLIDHTPGAGASVRTSSPEELLELYEFRQALEPFAARKAAHSITPPELALLRELCAEQQRLSAGMSTSGEHLENEALGNWLDIEQRFHETLVRAARNRHFDRAIGHSRVLAQLYQGHRAVGLKVTHAVTESTWRVHGRLVDALEARDADGAAACMLQSLLEGASTALASATGRPRTN